MFLMNVNDFILLHSGVSGLAILNNTHRSSTKPIFFQPYESVADPFWRILSIGTAPILLSLYAVGNIVASFYKVIEACVNRYQGNSEIAGSQLFESALYLAVAVFSAVSAFTSPFVNFIDLLGGGFKGCVPKQEVNDELDDVLNRAFGPV